MESRSADYIEKKEAAVANGQDVVALGLRETRRRINDESIGHVDADALLKLFMTKPEEMTDKVL